MMEGTRILQLIFFILALSYHYGIDGQVTAPPSTAAALGDDVSLQCTTTQSNPTFIWADGDTGAAIYTGTIRVTGEPDHANVVLGTSSNPQTSILNINAIEMNDDGNYTCYLTGQSLADAEETMVTVEVGSSSLPIALTSNDTHYRATCEALESKPAETITWFLAGVEQSDGIEVTTLDATPPLSSIRSTFTFPATRDNYNDELRCVIGGHQVTRLNREETRLVDDHNPPEPQGIIIQLNSDGTSLTVSCNINLAVDPAIPAMDMFYIYENGTLINKPPSDRVTVTEPEQDTEYMCVGGNYLGNTTDTDTFQPGRTTTLPTPTDMMTSPGPNDGNETGGRSGGDGPSAAAIGGGVAGAIVFIIIIVIVIIYFKKRGKDGLQGLFTSCNCCLRCCNCCLPCCNCCLPSDGGNPPPRKHPSAVGTSNGSEKDKIKPVAAPRDQGSIQHTTDNPGQAEYAMVDRKKPGGDMPDTRGPGQKEPPQGMLYADLDLSASAGHTEKKVPQNKDDVVVYSSILV